MNDLFFATYKLFVHRMATMNTTIAYSRYFLSLTRLKRTWNDKLPGVETIKRCFSVSSPVVVQEIERKVKQYGKLVIDVPWNVEVKPTDPHEYPDMDTLVVKLLTNNEIVKQSNEFVSIDITDNCCKITASEKNLDYPNNAKFLVEAPIQYDVSVQTVGDTSIKVTGMVSDLINVKTEKGDITGGKLQSKQMIFNSTKGGSVDLRHSLQGNIVIKTSQNGSISAEKCLGTSLEIQTEKGDVNLGSNYCEQSKFRTVDGNLILNNLHMDSNIDINGNGSLDISCLDGSLQAKVSDGETKIQLVRLTGKSHIVSEGPVHLIVPRENNVQLNLQGNTLSLDESLNGQYPNSDNHQIFKTNGEVPLDVKTSNSLRVTTSSWAESLKLGKFAK